MAGQLAINALDNNTVIATKKSFFPVKNSLKLKLSQRKKKEKEKYKIKTNYLP